MLGRDHKAPACLSLEQRAQHRSQGAPASETRAGLWVRLLGPGTLAAPSRAALLEWPAQRTRTRTVGGRAAALGSGPRGGRGHLLSMGPPAPLLGRTPGAVRARLNLHVHGTDVARLVLSDPQLPVFGWVHFSKQLVHRLDCLQGTEKGTQSELAAAPGTTEAPVRDSRAQGCKSGEPRALSPTLLRALRPQPGAASSVCPHPDRPRTGPTER